MKNNLDDTYSLWLRKYRKAVKYLESYKKEKAIFEFDDWEWSKLENKFSSGDDILKWILKQRDIVTKEFNLGDFKERLTWEQIELLQKAEIVSKQEQFTKEEIDILLKNFSGVYWGYKCPVAVSSWDIKRDIDGVIKRMAYHLFVYVNEYYFSVKGQNFTLEDYIREGYLSLIKGIESYNSSCGDYSRYLEVTIFNGLREKFYLNNVIFKECIKMVAKEYLQGDFSINVSRKIGDVDGSYEVVESLVDQFRGVEERSYNILKLRILDKLAFEEIGKYYGISKQRVYEVYQNSIKKLANSLIGNRKCDICDEEEFRKMVDYCQLVKKRSGDKKLVSLKFGESYDEKIGVQGRKSVGKVLLREKK